MSSKVPAKLKHQLNVIVRRNNNIPPAAKDIVEELMKNFAEYTDHALLSQQVSAILQELAELSVKNDARKPETAKPDVVADLNRIYSSAGTKRSLPEQSESEIGTSTEPATPVPEAKESKLSSKASSRKVPRVEGMGEPPKEVKEVKEKKPAFAQARPIERLDDVAGVDSIVTKLRKIVFLPVQRLHLHTQIKNTPKCSILIHGPSGCGKTLLAHAVAGELGMPYFESSGPDLISSMSGDSEKNIKEIFAAALAAAPSVLFIDGFDTIAGGGESAKNMDRRMVETLCKCLRQVKQEGLKPIESIKSEEVATDSNGGSSSSEEEQNASSARKIVVVIAATNRLDGVDARIKAHFGAEVGIPMPDETARAAILRRITINERLASSVDFNLLGKKTAGYVGADLENLFDEATRLAILRNEQSFVVQQTQLMVNGMEVVGDETSSTSVQVPSDLQLELQDFILALKEIVPTAKKEGFAMPPNVTWKDIGALKETRAQIFKHVIGPMVNRARYSKLGLSASAGVMFFGPPGCGKTLLAKALANSSRANFISVKGPELLNQYVGQSEAQVRQVFERASQTKPCVIFFDEIDALVPKRSSGSDGSGNRVTDRVVNQLLTELDGVTAREDVYVIGATNRLDTLDPAILRPGRLGTLLYVPLPDEGDRASILRAILRSREVRWKYDQSQLRSAPKVILHEDGVDVDHIAKHTDGFSGADMKALCDSAAGVIAEEHLLAESLEQDPDLHDLIYGDLEEVKQPAVAAESKIVDGEICMALCARHFDIALKEVRPSVAEDERRRFGRIDAKIRAGVPAVEAIQQVVKEEEEND